MEAVATSGVESATTDEKSGSEAQLSEGKEDNGKEDRPAGVKRRREEDPGASEEEELERWVYIHFGWGKPTGAMLPASLALG